MTTIFSGLLGGILFRSFVDLGFSLVMFLVFISSIIFCLARFYITNEESKRFQIIISICLLSFAIGIFRYDQVDQSSNLSDISQLANRTIQVEGVVVDEPKEKDRMTTLMVYVSQDEKIFFNVLVLTRPYMKFEYGDKIKIYGKLQEIKNFSMDTSRPGTDFDYKAYLAKDEIYYQFLDPKISVVSRGNGSYIQGKLFEIKNSFLDKLNSVIPEPGSSLMGGIILGAKSALDKDLTNDFKRVGLIHIVALSGYNVTVVADSLMRVIWFLPLLPKLIIGSMVIILFALMTGGGSTVMRASLMVLLAMLARATGRIYLVGSALLVAAVGMILYNPKIFVFDISFQLSFLATAGLIFFTPILEKYLYLITDRFQLRGMLVSTLAAQLAVWPIILYKMGNFSLVSIPANLLVGPVIPVTMFLGFLTGFVGYISYYVSLIFGVCSYFFLFYIIKITEPFSALPFASISISSFPLIITIGIYMIYFAIIVTVDSSPTKC